jgi:hypothetical protein
MRMFKGVRLVWPHEVILAAEVEAGAAKAAATAVIAETSKEVKIVEHINTMATTNNKYCPEAPARASQTERAQWVNSDDQAEHLQVDSALDRPTPRRLFQRALAMATVSEDEQWELMSYVRKRVVHASKLGSSPDHHRRRLLSYFIA